MSFKLSDDITEEIMTDSDFEDHEQMKLEFGDIKLDDLSPGISSPLIVKEPELIPVLKFDEIPE